MIFFSSAVSPENENIVTFKAIENEVVSGSCILKIDGARATVISLSYVDDKSYICEGLIKTAFNYACLKNCYMGYICIDKKLSLLDSMGFQKDENVYFNDILTILMGNCCRN